MIRRDDRGSLLVVTLWLIIALSAGAVALSSYLSTETRLMRYHIASAQARAWAEGGVILALERLAEDAKNPERSNPDKFYDWLGDQWAYMPDNKTTAWVVPLTPGDDVSGGGATVTIQVTDEERKLDINQMTAKNYHQVFLQLFKTQPEAVNLIADYLHSDPAHRPQGIGGAGMPSYVAKDAPVKTLAELEGIPGLVSEAELMRTLREEVTVAGVKTLNINTADVNLLKALFEAAGKPGLAERVVEYRWDPSDGGDVRDGGRFVDLTPPVQTDGRLLNDQLKKELEEVMVGPFGTLLGVQSNVFTVIVTAQTTTPSLRYRIEAVVERNASLTPSDSVIDLGKNSGKPFKLLAWKER